jgi:CubicO group peptidase (beta-lactamase class C family)
MHSKSLLDVKINKFFSYIHLRNLFSLSYFMEWKIYMKSILILLIGFSLISACSQENQSPLTLNKGGISQNVHKENIGKIAFMENWIPLDQFQQSDFTHTLSLTNRSDLAMRVFLPHTLTYELKKLAPELTTRELCALGNFQVNFTVNERLIYSSNIPPGAGSCEYKNVTTAYGIPFINKNNPDHWGRFLWTKFMKKGGGQEAFKDGYQDLQVSIRAYIEHKELRVSDIMAQGKVKVAFFDEEVNPKLVAIQTPHNHNNWELSQHSFDKSLVQQLNTKIAQGYFKNITSMVVVKDGKLLMEQYYNNANKDTLHDTRSVTKSIVSSLTGIAIEQQLIESVDETINTFYNFKDYANFSQNKTKISIKNLLTMNVNLEGSDMDPDSVGNEEKMYPTKDWVKFTLDLPIDDSKVVSSRWDYFTAGVVLLGDILNRVSPNGLEQFAQENLFEPLQIERYRWQYTPTQIPNTAGSLAMRSIDLARWAQLYIDGGSFDEKQILPKLWVEDSFQQLISTGRDDESNYGYLFWHKAVKAPSNKELLNLFYASGNGGSRVVIVPENKVVIVITATAYNQPYMHHQTDEMVSQYILTAIKQ